MARGPMLALQLTDEDKEAVAELEEYIDESPQMAAFDGGELKVPIPTKLYTANLATRTSVRYKALVELYAKAGWKQVSLLGQGDSRVFVLNQHEYRSSGGRD